MTLPTRQEVRQQVTALLAPLAAVEASYAATAKVDDLYEALLLVQVMEVAANLGWFVSLEDRAGRPVNSLLLRKGPGRLAATNNYTHVVLRKHERALEAHVGVKIRGTSGVLHECDVLVLPRRVAHACREDHTDPAAGQLVWLAEAKSISARTVPLGYARGLVGLAEEVWTNNSYARPPALALVCPKPGPSARNVLHHHGHAQITTRVTPGGVIDLADLSACVAWALWMWEMWAWA